MLRKILSKMNPEHKKYILENIGKKSIKRVASEIGIKERKVIRFLESEKKQAVAKPGPTCKPESRIDRKSIIISVLLLIILGFICYGNSITHRFIYDDISLITDNIYIRSWSNIENIFTKNLAAGGVGGWQSSFYRPIQMLTYMMDFSIWKLNPAGYHFTSTVLHILAALCIYWFIDILYSKNILSFLVAAFFAVHPVHTEAVAYISGRADSLALIFIILTFISYLKQLNSANTASIRSTILLAVSYILALFAKENSLILPALIMLYHYTFKEKIKPAAFLSILGISLIYIALRLTVLKALLSNVSYATTLFQRLPGFFAALTSYVRILLAPLDLHMEYGKKLFEFTDARSLLGMAILVSALIFGFIKRNRNKLVFFSIFWFFITLLPVSNLYPINAYMAEHWLYLPSLGFFLLLAGGVTSLYKNDKFKIVAMVIAIAILSFYSCLTIRQNGYWKDQLTFYERTLKYAPDSPIIYNNLANIYMNSGKVQEAIPLYKKAIELNPRLVGAYTNLGVLYANTGKIKEAIILYKKAIEFNPNDAYANNNLANIYKDNGRIQEAIALYKKSIKLDPNDAGVYYNLSTAYAKLGQYDLAVKYCDDALKLGFKVDPGFLNSIEAYRKR